MSRSKSERAFGFKADGLLRILSGADVEEVFKALEQLGIGEVNFDISKENFTTVVSMFALAQASGLTKVVQRFNAMKEDILNILDQATDIADILTLRPLNVETKLLLDTWFETIPGSAKNRRTWFRNILSDDYVLAFDNVVREFAAASADLKRLVDAIPDQVKETTPQLSQQEII